MSWKRPLAVLLASSVVAASSGEYSQHLQRQGLRTKVVAASARSDTGGEDQDGARVEALVLSKDIFYGRPILQLPDLALLGPATLPDKRLCRSVDEKLAKVSPEKAELLGMAFALVLEHRNPASNFRAWLDEVAKEPLLPALHLTARQRSALSGTTVEEMPARLLEDRSLIQAAAMDLPCFEERPLTREEAEFALGAIVRHAVPTESGPAVLLSLTELLHAQLHPNISIAAPLKLTDKHGQRSYVQVARRDMRAGEGAPPIWLGNYSSSELALLHNRHYSRNPFGVGGKLVLPPNWSENRNTPNAREFRKYNCSTPRVFEIRVSTRGWPMRIFVRCSRIAYHLAHSSYKPTFVERMDLLDKWPPPKKYSIDDWLVWTQADQTINKQIHEYCISMKQQLKEAITSSVADDFRESVNQVDMLLWKLRSDEAKAFRECVQLAGTVSSTD